MIDQRSKFRQFLELFGVIVLILSVLAVVLWAIVNYGPAVMVWLFTDAPRWIWTTVEANPIVTVAVAIIVFAAGVAWNAVYAPKDSEKKKNDQPVKLGDDGELVPEIAEQAKGSAES